MLEILALDVKLDLDLLKFHVFLSPKIQPENAFFGVCYYIYTTKTKFHSNSKVIIFNPLD